MLTNADIDKIMRVFATKAELKEVKSELSEKLDFVMTRVEKLPETLDAITKNFADLRDEYIAIKMQTDRHDGWIHQLADKTHTKLQE